MKIAILGSCLLQYLYYSLNKSQFVAMLGGTSGSESELSLRRLNISSDMKQYSPLNVQVHDSEAQRVLGQVSS